jgi:hypothetical protein
MRRFLNLIALFRSRSPRLVGSIQGILCLNLTLMIPLLALLGWVLFGPSGDRHTNTKITRCLMTAAGGFLANLPIGALMGAVAPSLRKRRRLTLVGIGLLAAVAEGVLLGSLGKFAPLPVVMWAGIWFMWACAGGVLALLPVAWVLERWTRPTVDAG